jgi:class I fructose-bisphosphate aldolase
VESRRGRKRIGIFSGGAWAEDEALFAEVRAIREGGGFGSIVGRNSFQRQRAESLAFLRQVRQLYAGEIQ